MATKKTTSPSAKAKTGSAKPKAATRGKASAAKSDPVILDPPAKTPAAGKKPAVVQDVVIDAKAEDVTKPAPKEKPEPVKVEPKPQSKPGPAKTPEPLAAKPQAANGTRAFAGFLAGGAVAALIGYFAAGYINPAPVVPDNSAEIAALSAQYNAKITALEAKIGAAPQSSADLEALQAALQDQAKQLMQTQSRLDQALSDLEVMRKQQAEILAGGLAASGGDVSAATAALIKQYGDEIASLKTRIEAQGLDRDALSARLDEVSNIASQKLAEAQAKVEEMTNSVTSSAKSVDLTLTRERLIAAVESGKAYGALLSQIANTSGAEIPAALSDAAATGVATLEQLRKDFPAAARSALKISLKSEVEGGVVDQIGAYLKAQIGARSLEEREGDDPDAILSRVEGALSRGELAAAVKQAQQLPASGLAELAGWLTAAQTRLNVEAALEELSSAIDGSE